MPELPEVEATRLTVDAQCLNRTIVAAEPGDDVTYIELPGDNERARLIGHQFTRTRRHGKVIFAGSSTGPWIAVHYGMTGKLIPFDAPADPPDHTKFLITFEGDRRLAFRCPRKLGWMKVIDDPDAFIADEGLGPDALDIGREAFAKAIGGSRGAVKAALLDQGKLAGIGNLWSDEILFREGVNPSTKGTDLSDEQLAGMFDAMHAVIAGVVDTGGDYALLPDDWLNHARDEGADCPRCGGTITKRTVGGRSAYFCDRHQA